MLDTLRKMGISNAFRKGVADFSGMDGTKNLYISEVIHKAFVEIDEKGTEAAAATATFVGWGSVGSPEKIPVFRADHPFIFIIQQKETGNILFMGRINNPNK